LAETLANKLFVELERRGKVYTSGYDLRNYMGWGKGQFATAIRMLKLSGCLETVGQRRGLRYRLKPKAKNPQDTRGRHKNSQANLNRGGYPMNLMKWRIQHGQIKRVKPTPTNALEAYWSWTPNV